MQTINKSSIANQVFEVVESADFYLPIGEKLILEYLDKGDDGLFPSEKSWRSFISGNFLNGEYFIESPKPTTIKKWCYEEDNYINRFAQHIGGDQYIAVDAANIKLTFDYEVFYSRDGSNFPSCVYIYVTANLIK